MEVVKLINDKYWKPQVKYFTNSRDVNKFLAENYANSKFLVHDIKMCSNEGAVHYLMIYAERE